MRSLATLALPGTYTSPGELLVGRTIANAQFLEGLVRHGSFEEVRLVVGESSDLPALERLAEPWNAPEGRLTTTTPWQLPHLLGTGAIDVLHHGSHVDRLYDLVALRDRYATKPTPVTGQLHSLSYPRVHQDLARSLLLAPSGTDAIFCSSTAGRRVLERETSQVQDLAVARGLGRPAAWSLPHVPLGVDVDALRGGNRQATRKALHLPDDAVVLLSLARFTEYDKMDMFPVLQVLERLVHAPTPGAPEVYLLLAGARQGTKTPEMIELWSRWLGVHERVRLKVDFRGAEKKDLLAAADVFVSPVDNVQETFGQSVVEAMAAGLPVVVSDFDGYKDTVDDEVGLRVTTRLGVDWSELSELGPLLHERPLHLVLGQSVEVDLASLEASLREVLVNRPRREAMAATAAGRARTRYDWRVVIPQYEAHWRELAKAPWQRPADGRHPLRLDFGDAFAHYASAPWDPAAKLVRSAFSRRAGTPYVVYPELKALLLEDDVRHALGFCEVPRTAAEVMQALEPRLGERPRWAAGFAVAWLVKHGLLERVP